MALKDTRIENIVAMLTMFNDKHERSEQVRWQTHAWIIKHKCQMNMYQNLLFYNE